MHPSPLDFHRFNPLRHPDWRCERVLRLMDQLPMGRVGPRGDAATRALRLLWPRFRAASPERRYRLAPHNPGLYLALELYTSREDDPEAARCCAAMEARLLAGQSYAQIATAIGSLPELPQWYGDLFFDVRHSLVAHDWVLNQVLIPAYLRGGLLARMVTTPVERDEEKDGEGPVSTAAAPAAPVPPPLRRWALLEPFYDPAIKFFAYYGGPAMLELVFSGFQRSGRCPSDSEAARWLDRAIRNNLRRKTSLASVHFEVNPSNVMTLFNTHNLLLAAEQQAAAKGGSPEDLANDMSATAALIVDTMTTQLKMKVGDHGRHLLGDSPLLDYTNTAAELSFAEQAALSAGADPDTIKAVSRLALPPPPERGDPVAGMEASN